MCFPKRAKVPSSVIWIALDALARAPFPKPKLAGPPPRMSGVPVGVRLGPPKAKLPPPSPLRRSFRIAGVRAAMRAAAEPVASSARWAHLRRALDVVLHISCRSGVAYGVHISNRNHFLHRGTVRGERFVKKLAPSNGPKTGDGFATHCAANAHRVAPIRW